MGGRARRGREGGLHEVGSWRIMVIHPEWLQLRALKLRGDSPRVARWVPA